MQRCHCNLAFSFQIHIGIIRRTATHTSAAYEFLLTHTLPSRGAHFNHIAAASSRNSTKGWLTDKLLRCAEYRFICPAQKPGPTPSLQTLLAMLLPKCPNAAERADQPSMRRLRPRRLAITLKAIAWAYLADPLYWPISCQGRG